MKPEPFRDLSDIFIFSRSSSEGRLNTTAMKINNGYNICFWSKLTSTNTNYYYREGISPLLAKKSGGNTAFQAAGAAIWSLDETGQGKPDFLTFFQMSVLKVLTGQRSGITNPISEVLSESFTRKELLMEREDTFKIQLSKPKLSKLDSRSCFSCFKSQFVFADFVNLQSFVIEIFKTWLLSSLCAFITSTINEEESLTSN